MVQNLRKLTHNKGLRRQPFVVFEKLLCRIRTKKSPARIDAVEYRPYNYSVYFLDDGRIRKHKVIIYGGIKYMKKAIRELKNRDKMKSSYFTVSSSSSYSPNNMGGWNGWRTCPITPAPTPIWYY